MELSAKQMAAVTDGDKFELPEGAPLIEVEIIDGPILSEEQFAADWRHLGHTLGVVRTDSIGGRCAIFPLDPAWIEERRAKYSGNSGTHYYVTNHGSGGWADSHEEAVAKIYNSLRFYVQFWMEKVCNGSTVNGLPVVRANGHFYVLGKGDSRIRGFGGRQFAFVMNETGERITCSDVWTAGTIPTEFRELLPDNAVQVDSDETIARKAKAAADREYALSKGWTVEEFTSKIGPGTKWFDPSGRERSTSYGGPCAPMRFQVDEFEEHG